MRHRFRALVVMTMAAALALPALARAQGLNGPCKLVFDAMLKETTTPHHAVTTKDGVTIGESITVGDATYVKAKGQWRKSPMSPKDQLAQQQENISTATVQKCTALADDVVDGKPAAVYQTHYEQQDLGASDAKVWIAKATGLPLRTDATMQAGQKVSVVTKFDYDHITAPIVK